MEAGLSGAHGSPSDSVSGIIKTSKGTSETLSIGKKVFAWDLFAKFETVKKYYFIYLDVIEENHAGFRSSERIFAGNRWGINTFPRSLKNESLKFRN